MIVVGLFLELPKQWQNNGVNMSTKDKEKALIEHIKLWHLDCIDCEIAEVLKKDNASFTDLINIVREVDSDLFESFNYKES